MGTCQSINNKSDYKSSIEPVKDRPNKSNQLAVFNNPLLICQACKNQYTEQHYIPKNLPCGHTICSICILNMKENSPIISCPFDSHVIESPNLPTSLAILNMIKEAEESSEIRNKKFNFKDEIKNIVLVKVDEVLKNSKCIISDSVKNDEYIKIIVEKSIKSLRDKYLNHYFSVKVFLFSKIYNYCIDGQSYLPINDEKYTYMDHCIYENSNWICHVYVLACTKSQRTMKDNTKSFTFAFIEEDVKNMVIDLIKTTISKKEYYNNDEAVNEMNGLIKVLMSDMKNFLVNYCFSIEFVFKNRTEGFLLAKEADYMEKGVDGTIWVSDMVNKFYSFFIFVTIFKIY